MWMDHAIAWDGRDGRGSVAVPDGGLAFPGGLVVLPDRVMAERVAQLDPLLTFAARAMPRASVLFVPSLWLPRAAAEAAWPFLDPDAAEQRVDPVHGELLRITALHLGDDDAPRADATAPRADGVDGQIVVALTPLWMSCGRAFFHEAWHYAARRLLAPGADAALRTAHAAAMAAAPGGAWAFHAANPEEWACDLFADWAALAQARPGVGWGDADAVTTLFRAFAEGRLAA